jgi:hypothetical protein
METLSCQRGPLPTLWNNIQATLLMPLYQCHYLVLYFRTTSFSTLIKMSQPFIYSDLHLSDEPTKHFSSCKHGFKDLTAVALQNAVFWNVLLYALVEVHQWFTQTLSFHF